MTCKVSTVSEGGHYSLHEKSFLLLFLINCFNSLVSLCVCLCVRVCKYMICVGVYMYDVCVCVCVHVRITVHTSACVYVCS